MSEALDRAVVAGIDSPLAFAETDPAIGLHVRSSRSGAESALVQHFVTHALDTFGSRSQAMAVFCEPRLESGCPDLVITLFNPRRYERWPASRALLHVQDLKVLQHLHTVGSTNIASLSAQLGLHPQDAEDKLAKLHDANLARRIHAQWRPYALRHTYGIKRLIAIEAKIKDWSVAFRQATMNRWFASETYILSPVVRPSRSVCDRAAHLGVGLYTCNEAGIVQVAASDPSGLPACYASWLFNEWIGRSLNS